MKYSFSGQRSMTIGIQHSIRIDLQIYLWSLIDLPIMEKKIEPDYLQIIELASMEEDRIINDTHYFSAFRSMVKFPLS